MRLGFAHSTHAAWIFALATALLHPAARADAVRPYEAVPVSLVQFEHTDRLNLHRVSLALSTTKVNAKMAVQNPTDEAISSMAWFSFPRVFCDGKSDTRILGDVVLLVNGDLPPNVAFEERAVYRDDGPEADLRGVEISERLKAAMLPLDCNPIGPGDLSRPKSHPIGEYYRQAVRSGLGRLGLEGDWKLYWYFQKKLFWQQTFPPRSETVFELEYAPLLGAKPNKDATDRRWLSRQNGFVPAQGGLVLLNLITAFFAPFEKPVRYLDLEVRTNALYPYFGNSIGKLLPAGKGFYRRTFENFTLPRQTELVYQKLDQPTIRPRLNAAASPGVSED